MSSEHTSPDDNREALIDALLRSACVDERTTVANRVDEVMRQIEIGTTVSGRLIAERTRLTRRTWSRRVSWAIAATLLVALFIGLQYLGPARQALAAVEQSLAAAAEQIARKYLITVTFKNGNRRREVGNDLYVQGNDRFALRHPALLPGADGWLGKNGDQAWVVPSFGPVRTGNDLALSRWLSSQEQLSTPYLHVTTVLDRMSRGYRLQELGEATIRTAEGNDVVCRHVLGELKTGKNPKLPATIELWSDAQTGVAMRVEARWPLSTSESGREEVVLEFAGQPELPDNWFDPEGHYSGSRRKITFDSKENE
jgi:hypothetical protein